MQLNEILEENSIKGISKRTNISEDNIEALLAKDFNKLKKVKTLGFISIIEREYKADLSDLREESLAHYLDVNGEESISLGLPIMEEKKGTSKLFIILVLGLLGYASWYFFTQFDQKQLSDLLPFIEDNNDQAVILKEASNNENLSIENAIIPIKKNRVPVQKIVVEEKIETEIAQTIEENNVSEIKIKTTSQEEITPSATEKEYIFIIPVGRLWFGIIDMQIKQRDHFSISEKFKLDVKNKSWLVATSSAPFSLVDGEEIKKFDDAKEHYFKISKSGGIEQLTKADYVTQGGWSQW